MIDFITTHPWTVCMGWILACFFLASFIHVGRERDDDARRLALRMFGRDSIRRVQ